MRRHAPFLPIRATPIAHQGARKSGRLRAAKQMTARAYCSCRSARTLHSSSSCRPRRQVRWPLSIRAGAVHCAPHAGWQKGSGVPQTRRDCSASMRAARALQVTRPTHRCTWQRSSRPASHAICRMRARCGRSPSPNGMGTSVPALHLMTTQRADTSIISTVAVDPQSRPANGTPLRTDAADGSSCHRFLRGLRSISCLKCRLFVS